MNKLVSAHQKKRDGDREWNHNRTAERYHNRMTERWTCKVSNACSFDTAEKAEAHETLCAAKKSLVAKWTCDVCKSHSFVTFEDAEAHEKECYVPPLHRGCKWRKDTSSPGLTLNFKHAELSMGFFLT